MSSKPGVAVARVALSDREIDFLFLRASECAKASPLRLVKQAQPALDPGRKSHRSAA
jgi:hypothetical protein